MALGITQEQYLSLARDYLRIAVSQELSSDTLTPISVFKTLAEIYPDAAMLETGSVDENNRYSLLYFEPYAKVSGYTNDVVEIIENNKSNITSKPFLEATRAFTKQQRCYDKSIKKSGSIFGYLTYDAIRLFEKIPNRHALPKNLPLAEFRYYRIHCVFDHQSHKISVSIISEVKDNPLKAYQSSQTEIEKIIEKITQCNQRVAPLNLIAKNKNVHYELDLSNQTYEQITQTAQKYIADGEAFQIVLSRCFKQKISITPFEIYRTLRLTNPSPFHFYLSINDTFYIGSSPERQLKVDNHKVSVNPLAGTCPLSEDPTHLLNDKKQRAEHMMLIDLARNDLGQVCQAGTVTIEKLMKINRLQHVAHISSEVTGILQPKYDLFDAIRATFPAGTLSGAPKIRAMQIIDELETSRRGLYGGLIGYMDYLGNFDSCIAIRMAEVKNHEAFIRAGAGIVYDSIPNMEAEETFHKARAILEAIALSGSE